MTATALAETSGVAARISGDGSATIAGMTLDSHQVRAGDLYCCLPGRAGRRPRLRRERGRRGGDGAPGGPPPRRRRRSSWCPTRGWPSARSARRHLLGPPLGPDGDRGYHRHEQEDDDQLPAGRRPRARRLAHRGDGHADRLPSPAEGARAAGPAGRDGRVRAAGGCVEDLVARLALRVDGIAAVAVFTNLGNDHLDLHGTIERYFAAKADLFTPDRAAVGVVNVDDVPAASSPTPRPSRSSRSAWPARRPSWWGRPAAASVGGATGHAAPRRPVQRGERAGGGDVARSASATTTSPPASATSPRCPAAWRRSTPAVPVVVDFAHTPGCAGRPPRRAPEVTAGRVIVVFRLRQRP